MAVFLNRAEREARQTNTCVGLCQGAALLLWLGSGIYLFTQMLLFNSVHFDVEERTLTLVETIYLLSQIITTVGYGDITPSRMRGQIFVALYVFFAIIRSGRPVSWWGPLGCRVTCGYGVGRSMDRP